jgi:hypothetical protein
MSYGFVAYIDESGDDGLKRVKPKHPNGATEWFVLGAMVVRASNENAVGAWQRDLRLNKLRQTQRTDIHFRDLTSSKKLLVCDEISAHPLRCFVAMSNKKNIENWSNPRCYQERNYLYWWMTRLLLERVTRFCSKASVPLYGHSRPIKFVFSQRGGMSYDRLRAYMGLIGFQSDVGSLFNKTGDLSWDVVDLKQFHVMSHKNEAGLQFADSVAGAFYQAVSVNDAGECNPEYAKRLHRVLYRGPRGRVLGYGVKHAPWTIEAMKLMPQQRQIFDFLSSLEKR